MGFTDVIKNGVLEQFHTGITLGDMLLSLAVSFLMGLFILLVYRQTFRGVLFSKGFAFSLVLLCMVTSVVIRTISSDLALSLGMVGALSIVRFRTAIKDPVDTIFMFWSIASGIMSGAGLYLPGGLSCLILGVLYYAITVMYRKNRSPYLLIIRYDPPAIDEVKKALKKLPKYRVKSRIVTRNGGELTVEVSLVDNETKIIDTLLAVEGVQDASLVSYEGEFGL